MSKTNSKLLSTIFRYLKTRPTFESVGIEAFRKLLEKSAAAFRPDPAATYNALEIDNIPAQWIIPPDPNEMCTILYIHGGGYIAGSIDSHRDLASRIAMAANARLLIFNYRLAPEYPFPAGLDDVSTVYRWLLAQTKENHRICLVGDSAGGGLCLSLLTVILNKLLPLPACSVLISPWIDLECKNPSYQYNEDTDPMLSRNTLKKTARLYTDKDLHSPLISPINNDFAGITPLLIQVGQNEVLLDDARLLAQKIQTTGALAQLEIWEDMFHVWHYFARYLSEGRDAIAKIGKFIQLYSHPSE